MRAVSDAGPLIHLSWIDHLAVLTSLFDEVLIPPAVREEIFAVPPGTLGLDHIEEAFAQGRFQVRIPGNPPRLSLSSGELDAGEIEAINLANDTEADLLITDDTAARRAASRNGLEVIGTVGVLIQARREGIVPETFPLLLELRRYGQWMSEELLHRVREDEAGR